MKTLLNRFAVGWRGRPVAGPASVALLAVALWSSPEAAHAATVLVEAESFTQHGGWKLDTQFIQLMGSPYLLAHGLGVPVADATTTVTFPKAGAYRIFVRTKDWVAPWKAPGTPGKFQVLVDGRPIKETFGTRGTNWFWHDGGVVEIGRPQATLALHDLTGFDGRCDAILFTDDAAFAPPNDSAPMASWRRQLRGLPDKPVDLGAFDVVVIGGGYAGMCSAISAARMGCRVALVQDRAVLGGNGSSEIRVWPQGLTRRGLYPRLGEIVEELVDRPTQSPGPEAEFNDARREAIVRAEKNLSLFLNHYAYAVETNSARIVAVVAMDTVTGETRRFAGRLFVDCTGHATIGALAGAEYAMEEKGHMGMSNMWRWKLADEAVPFPLTPWALNLRLGDFPYPNKYAGEWFWESGFDRHPIHDLEYVRDWNLRAVFGAFNAMKNGEGTNEHRRAVLEWVAYVGGNRESRRLLGDVLLTQDDIVGKREFPDGCVPTTWDIDLHYPQEKFAQATPEDPFISRAVFGKGVDKKEGYPVPYRCFYSRNIGNLFMAGRDISVTHEALGTVRVQKTTGMMGEVVGKAASLCVKYHRTPRDIFGSYLEELKELMRQPGVARRDSVNSPIYIPRGAQAPPLPGATVVSVTPVEDGVVIDDAQALLMGNWQGAANLKPFAGDRYLYHGPKGEASAGFQFTVQERGRYEVQLLYQAHTNRASNTRVTVHGAGDAMVRRINQRAAPPLPGGFLSLGDFEFRPGVTNRVVIDNTGADGNVSVDAVRVLPKR